MTDVFFVTQNRGKADEIQRLLAGLPIATTPKRPPLTHVPGDDLEAAARARVCEAYEALGAPCFLENTGLWVHESGIDAEPSFPPRTFKRELDRLGGEAAFTARYGGAPVRARVAVAYTDGVEPIVFSGELAGAVATEPRGTGGYGWDRVVVPEGYQRTLSELAEGKYLTNMRLLPYVALAARLRGVAYDGIFEAHVTVRVTSDAERERFAAACDELGVKYILIALPTGATASQPMTASYHRGLLEAVQAEVLALGAELMRRGFAVTRTKIEAIGAGRDVPEDDAAARARPRDNYFEYHVKVRLSTAREPDAVHRLRGICATHRAHLSRSARAVSDGGVETRFVTQRAYGAGRVSSGARFDALVRALEEGGFRPGKRLREYTVYDSDVGVDAGWIDPP
ncbi:MAG: non-canonical purine NTP pyrophosphatase [Polyangiaceae bacterium]